jgi:D-beta-D-heptose 7-phosphate kinase/D-beta-D-heptose 1-phosphate adenosyltransferase
MKMDVSAVGAALSAIQGRPVLVVGDVMLDRFVDGVVTRISPEAPVPVLGKTHAKEMPGGAANVACNLAHLGCHVRLIGIVGEDETATLLQRKIEQAPGIEFTPMVVAKRATSAKTRFRAAGQQILRVDEEETGPLDPADAEKLTKTIIASLPMSDVIVLSDYAKGCLPPLVIAKIVAAAKGSGKTIIADPKLTDFSAYAGVDVLTPNLGELHRAAASDSGMDSLADIAQQAAKLASANNIGAIIATLSARGMVLAPAKGNFVHEPAIARDVFDVSGAGDTVVAMLAAAIAGGAALDQAMSLANLAAGVAVGKSGTAIVSPGEMIAQMAPSPPPLDTAHWQKQITEWRDAGKHIGFANGCFDLLHPGHMHLLNDAASRCDKLIIGLNSDASVRRLKGDHRPHQSAEIRAGILASMPQVAGVAIFDEDTPLTLITALEPDILVKGGDYNAEDVVGGDVVRARGGDVIITPTLGAHSSTGIVTR